MKNRFAQPLYGKIIYIFETNLTMEQLPTIFDPSTYWIDVTGVDCEVGYIVEFKEGAGLVFVPPPSSELTEEEKLQQEAELVQGELRNMAISAMMMSLAGDKVDSTAYQSKLRSVSDNAALYMVDKFPSWNVGKSYVVDDRVVYNDVLYKVLTAHTSQESWKPDVSPSLFVKVIRQVGDEIPEWQQPSANNAYMKGDKVRYEGKIYESLIDNNVWKPTDYPQGWKEVEQNGRA